MQSFFNFGQWKVCNPMLTIKNWVQRDCFWQRNTSKRHFKSMQVERHFMQQLHTGEWKFSLQPMYFYEPNAGLTLNKKMLIHLSTGRSESRSKRRSYMPSLSSQLYRMLVQLDLHKVWYKLCPEPSENNRRCCWMHISLSLRLYIRRLPVLTVQDQLQDLRYHRKMSRVYDFIHVNERKQLRK